MSLARTGAQTVAMSAAQDADAARAGHEVAKEEERALIERAQAGDRAAFRELYERYSSPVFRYAIMPLVRDRTLAEDLLADTFVRALENLHRFKWRGKGVLPWLIRIAKNLCLDHLRKSGRVAAWPMELEQMVPDPGEWDSESVVAHREITALLRDRIGECLGAINPRYRRVVELRLVQRMPRDQAAIEMEVSIGTLDVLLFRACKAFRKAYTERFGVGPRDPDLSAR